MASTDDDDEGGTTCAASRCCFVSSISSSEDEEDEAAQRSLKNTRSKNDMMRDLSTRSSLRAPAREEGGTQHVTDEVLHSQSTIREESLEVVQWKSTMAWI